MQDKTINSVLRHLHRECMNGRHDGLQLVLGLMRMRGVKPDFRKYAEPLGSRRAARLARLRRERELTASAPDASPEPPSAA